MSEIGTVAPPRRRRGARLRNPLDFAPPGTVLPGSAPLISDRVRVEDLSARTMRESAPKGRHQPKDDDDPRWGEPIPSHGEEE